MNAPASQMNDDPRVGSVLQDRYRILRKLGEGGMGAVYEAEHLLIRRRVAIKVLHPHFARNRDVVARFRREAEAATAIGHPNIIEVTDMGSLPDGTSFMVLELLEGRDWSKDIEQQGPQPLGKVVHILSQVCDALSAAHAKGIVHRDLKPENIFLLTRGSDPNFVKVLDFGISKISDPSNENRSLTQTGTAIGTPYYMAPEQCQGRKDIDHRADIYSLGVILFQALTGQYPFDDESYPMLVLKICTEPPPPLSRYRPDLPPAIAEILGRMLAKERAQRFGSCAELKAALEPFRHVHGAPVVAFDAPSTASQGPSVLGRVTGEFASSGGEPAPSFARVSSPVPGANKKNRALLFGLVAMFFAFVLVGGAFGILAAFGVFSPSLPIARDTPTSDPPPADDPAMTPKEEDPTATGAVVGTADPEPRAKDEDPSRNDETPSADQNEDSKTSGEVVAAESPEPQMQTEDNDTHPEPPATVRVRVAVEGPPAAQIFIDGAPWGSAPLNAELPRDPLPEPGKAPRLHTIEARAEGWRTARIEVPFTSTELERRIVMERARTRSDRNRQPIVQPTVRPFGTSGHSLGGSPPPRPGRRDLVGIDSLVR